MAKAPGGADCGRLDMRVRSGGKGLAIKAGPPPYRCRGVPVAWRHSCRRRDGRWPGAGRARKEWLSGQPGGYRQAWRSLPPDAEAGQGRMPALDAKQAQPGQAQVGQDLRAQAGAAPLPDMLRHGVAVVIGTARSRPGNGAGSDAQAGIGPPSTARISTAPLSLAPDPGRAWCRGMLPPSSRSCSRSASGL